jgi:heterodisulfide reductase subunit C
MIMKILLGIALLIFLAGVLYRGRSWFSQGIQPTGQPQSPASRIPAALRGVGTTLASTDLLVLGKTLITDVLLQKRLLAKSVKRWLAHSLIFVGFLLLLFMHGLGTGVSEFFFPSYYSTLQPFLTLRNVFGLLVLVGLAIALHRRLTDKPQRVKSLASDWLALTFVATIIISGFLLEGVKISSFDAYQAMVDDYGDVADEAEELALETYWAAEQGLVPVNAVKPYDPTLVETGREISSRSCAECHAPATGAFVSFSVAKVIGPLASALGDGGVVTALFTLHLLSCLALLAWLPFSKMFHVISVPVSLLINGVLGFKKDPAEPANTLTRQQIGLSACTHCGACSELCSSLMFYESFQNDFILPSEKVQLLKKVAAGQSVDRATLTHLQKGLYICTSCDRCSTVCPSGINLRELFVSARYYLLGRGIPETSLLSHFSFPLALARRFADEHLQALKKLRELFNQRFRKLADLSGLSLASTPASVGTDSYRSCYTCQRCTNICPVVRLYDDPVEHLDLLPHQIIYSLGIGNRELAMGARMIWSCSTCYLCQEHCPNQVELTDIFYRLKNAAIKTIDSGGTA